MKILFTLELKSSLLDNPNWMEEGNDNKDPDKQYEVIEIEEKETNEEDYSIDIDPITGEIRDDPTSIKPETYEKKRRKKELPEDGTKEESLLNLKKKVIRSTVPPDEVAKDSKNIIPPDELVKDSKNVIPVDELKKEDKKVSADESQKTSDSTKADDEKEKKLSEEEKKKAVKRVSVWLGPALAIAAGVAGAAIFPQLTAHAIATGAVTAAGVFLAGRLYDKKVSIKISKNGKQFGKKKEKTKEQTLGVADELSAQQENVILKDELQTTTASGIPKDELVREESATNVVPKDELIKEKGMTNVIPKDELVKDSEESRVLFKKEDIRKNYPTNLPSKKKKRRKDR